MSKSTSVKVQVGGKKLELTNPGKLLFPESGIVKAEVIDYYYRVAPTMLKHVFGRPITLIRYPDGISGEHFYQKNKPKGAPDFITYHIHDEHEYLLLDDPASVVWAANQAAVEIHQLQVKYPEFETPDYMVFDFDPPPEGPWEKVVFEAHKLKTYLESFGYFPLVKTTGGKGVHVVCPLVFGYTYDQVFETAKSLAEPWITKNPGLTLHLRKESRQDRILLDIFRNRNSQSIVAPYSLRAREGAPVSMPITWNQLEKTEGPAAYTLRNVIQSLETEGDAWGSFESYRTTLHTFKPKVVEVKELPENRRHKTPEQLAAYATKRDFSKTNEPKPEVDSVQLKAFVIQRHSATNLHYDLRLEADGVLTSWAVPRGMPTGPGIKRLAIQTEDHPLAYLRFEGEIPEGEYGAGTMEIFARGTYERTKEKKDGFYFRLRSPELSGEFRMHNTQGKEWLLERVDTPVPDWYSQPPEPMLASLATTPPLGQEYLHELKWDGIRGIFKVQDGVISIYSRNGNNLNEKFPELITGIRELKLTSAILDGEIVCLDPAGKPSFQRVISRLKGSASDQTKNPAVVYLFDLLVLDGRVLTYEPLQIRRKWLESCVAKPGTFRISTAFDDGTQLFAAAAEMQLEGIISKRRTAQYSPGKRSESWLKVKVRNTQDVFIIGYTLRKDDKRMAGALHIAVSIEDKLYYKGKVGTGFDEKTIKDLTSRLTIIDVKSLPKIEDLESDKDSVWVKPEIAIEISYASITRDGRYREPVFCRTLDDGY